MVESEQDKKPRFVGVTIKKRHNKFKILTIVLVLLVLSGAGYFAVFKYTERKNTNKNKVIIDGKTYTIDLIPQDQFAKTSPPTNEEVNKQINDLEAKKITSYNDYVSLAQLYEILKDNQKAIDNYNKAKQLVPMDQYYQATIDYINNRIKLVGTN